jgi:hypothetical protein
MQTSTNNWKKIDLSELTAWQQLTEQNETDARLKADALATAQAESKRLIEAQANEQRQLLLHTCRVWQDAAGYFFKGRQGGTLDRFPTRSDALRVAYSFGYTHVVEAGLPVPIAKNLQTVQPLIAKQLAQAEKQKAQAIKRGDFALIGALAVQIWQLKKQAS